MQEDNHKEQWCIKWNLLPLLLLILNSTLFCIFKNAWTINWKQVMQRYSWYLSLKKHCSFKEYCTSENNVKGKYSFQWLNLAKKLLLSVYKGTWCSQYLPQLKVSREHSLSFSPTVTYLDISQIPNFGMLKFCHKSTRQQLTLFHYGYTL